MPPKKSASTKGTLDAASRRRESQRKVAFERASHFARADQPPSKRLRSAASTTPTGVVQTAMPSSGQLPDESGNAYHWPGPFSTAHDMISKRDAVREARELALSTKKVGSVLKAATDMDVFDNMLHAARAAVKSNRSHTYVQGPVNVPSLSTLCVRVIAAHIDRIDELGDLSEEVRSELMAELAARRKLTAETLLLVIRGRREEMAETENCLFSGLWSLVLPDCSSIDEDTLVKAICTAAGNSCGEDSVSLRVLEMRNCGHGMTSWAAGQLCRHKKVLSGLEVLSLGGMYRISDENLSSLLLAVGDTSTRGTSSPYFRRGQDGGGLRSLSLTHTDVVGSLCIKALCDTFIHLESLSLDMCTIEESVLNSLCKAVSSGYSLSSLTELSLSGLEFLSDDHLSQLLASSTPSASSTHPISCSSSSNAAMLARKPLRSRLKLLSLKDCHGLTDKSLETIRSHCVALQYLDLSGIHSFTSEGLLELFRESEAYYPPLPSNNDIVLSSPDTAVLGPLHTVLLNNLSMRAVTDDVVAAVCRLCEAGGARGLRSFGMSGSGDGVSSRSIMAIQKHCSTSLHSLDISFVRGVCLDAVCSLIDNATYLRDISVWGCTQLLPARVKAKSRGPSLYGRKFDGRQELRIIGHMDN